MPDRCNEERSSCEVSAASYVDGGIPGHNSPDLLGLSTGGHYDGKEEFDSNILKHPYRCIDLPVSNQMDTDSPGSV